MVRNHDPVAAALAEPVVLAPYDPDWPQRFAAVAGELRALLPADLIGRIEHFGSTAVPGLEAKPIIDVLVEVPNLEVVRRRLAPILERAGYTFLWRPSSPGAPDIDYAWFIGRDATGRRSHHVHMLPPGRAFDERLAFRDYLRAHPEAARDYAALKRAAAAAHAGDRRAYAAAKGRFIRSALRSATRGGRGR